MKASWLTSIISIGALGACAISQADAHGLSLDLGIGLPAPPVYVSPPGYYRPPEYYAPPVQYYPPRYYPRRYYYPWRYYHRSYDRDDYYRHHWREERGWPPRRS